MIVIVHLKFTIQLELYDTTKDDSTSIRQMNALTNG